MGANAFEIDFTRGGHRGFPSQFAADRRPSQDDGTCHGEAFVEEDSSRDGGLLGEQ